MTVSTTLRHALHVARQQGLDRLDAQMLMLWVLGRDTGDRAWLMSHDQETLPADAASRWQSVIDRRARGEPLAYIVGSKDFFGLTLRVDARVLVPRPDTETLVQWVLDELATRPAPARVLDLGTGSGAIALAVKSQRPDAQVSASDASADALAVAAANAQQLQLEVHLHLGHWLQAVVAGQPFDIIASNPPYIAEGDAHLADLGHEPPSALTAGRDGLDDIRHLIKNAPAHLAPGGCVLFEHGHDQALAVRQLLIHQGFVDVGSRTDLAGIERCSGGTWPAQR